MSVASSLLTPAVMFFALGAGAQAFRADLKFPPDLVKALSIYLLVGIGLHGGAELAHASLAAAVQAVLAALVLGATLPLVAYAILVRLGRVGKLDAAAIAAHYGSVSAGTFLAASAYLQARGVAYEGYPVIMLAVMETPAIIIGLVLAQSARGPGAGVATAKGGTLAMLSGAARHGSIVLLVGSMLIGAAASPKALAAVMPFYETIFLGVLCLYLLELGMVAAQRLGDFGRMGGFLTAFGIAMPLIGAACGLAVGHYWLGLGAGGTTLVAVLGASASYIAVPPAVRMAIPEANPSLYLTLSLGITFPFNVVVGIPLYHSIATALAA
jgi:hypothetical protein